MSEFPAAPSRDEVQARWLAVLDGSMTRLQVHDWTVPWVEGDGSPLGGDPMIEGALQSLHGVTMAYNPATPSLIHHGLPGTYLKSMGDIRADYQRWEARSAEYDANPCAYHAERREVAEKYAEAERLRRATLAGGGDPPH